MIDTLATDSQPEILTVPEVAALLRISVDAVYDSLNKPGGIPGAKVGGRWRSRRSDILAMLSGHHVTPTADPERAVPVGGSESPKRAPHIGKPGRPRKARRRSSGSGSSSTTKAGAR